MKKFQIIGSGVIGSETGRILTAHFSWPWEFFGGRTADAGFIDKVSQSRGVFLAIRDQDPEDRGKIELEYALATIECCVPLAICTKNLLAYQFAAIRPYLHKFGFSASCGGASNMTSLLGYTPASWIYRIDAITNGTLNFISWSRHIGKRREAAIAAARKLHLCQPEMVDETALLNNEMTDALKKSCALWNLSELGPIITPDQFHVSPVSCTETARVYHDMGKSWFLVSIFKGKPEGDCSAGFRFYYKPWSITGSFVSNSRLNELMEGHVVERQFNAMNIRNTVYGSQFIKGIGAGATPTAATMILDMKMLLASNRHR